jgi:hypothetical protein
VQLLADHRMVARAVRRPGHGDHDLGTAGDPLLDGAMGEELRLVVEAEEPVGQVAPVAFVDDAPVRVAERVDRRDVDDAFETRRRRGVEDPMDESDVGVEHGRSLVGRDPDAVVAGQVDRGLRATHRIDDGRRAAEVALAELDAEGLEGRRPRRIANDGGHPVAAGHEPPDDGTTDEPGPTRDEDAHRPAQPQSART